MKQSNNILITGASGMLGGYINDEFSNPEESFKIFSLGRHEGNDFRCDLTSESPDFENINFETVVHCAGTEDNPGAMGLNHEGTKRLLKSLDAQPPKHFIFISSFRVYNPDEGTDLTEFSPASGTGNVGESKALAEKIVTDWARHHGAVLTIIRPARMFGSRVGGETLRLFNDALNGSYIHIRGNDARVSLVSALDVAKAIKKVYTQGGIYNAADGFNPRFIDMMEAMTANAGQQKRVTHLPATWAEWLWRLFRWIPAINRNLNPETAAQRMKTLTIDGSRLAEAAGISYHDTIKVISRTDPDYPYAE